MSNKNFTYTNVGYGEYFCKETNLFIRKCTIPDYLKNQYSIKDNVFETFKKLENDIEKDLTVEDLYKMDKYCSGIIFIDTSIGDIPKNIINYEPLIIFSTNENTWLKYL